jgi:hypothetical protein
MEIMEMEGHPFFFAAVPSGIQVETEQAVTTI